METTPLSTALTTFLSDPANAKAMMKTLVAAACNSSADNAGATALGGNYVHLLVDKSTGDIKFRSEADDAAVASEQDVWKAWKPDEIGSTLTLNLYRNSGTVLFQYPTRSSGIIFKGYGSTVQVQAIGSWGTNVDIESGDSAIVFTAKAKAVMYYRIL